MEASAYGERERMQMRELWRPGAELLARAEQSTYCDVSFAVPLKGVPDGYLTNNVKQWRNSDKPSWLWSDETGHGLIGELDLNPLQEEFEHSEILIAGSRVHELLAGRYVRNANYVQGLSLRRVENPRYMVDCDMAILLRWESTSPTAIDRKARDITSKLAKANEQLPIDQPGVVHIGFDAVEGDAVERARYEKVLENVARFDAGNIPLEYIYCHFFAPESPPNEAWAFDETANWFGRSPNGKRPLSGNMTLVVPDEGQLRDGFHWQS